MSKVVRFIATVHFRRAARKLFAETDLAAPRTKLADNPEVGDMVPGTGGARKVRQFGRRGASRVVYYFHLGRRWLYLITAYAKGSKDDLTRGEVKDLAAVVATIKKELKS